MYLRLLRIVWRIATAILVIAFTYITAFLLVPSIDSRSGLPLILAILIGYLVLAYVFLPLTLRFWQIVFRPNHIPRYVTTPDGWAADPVNIAIVASSKKHLIEAMKAAGWYQADPATIKNLLREAYAIVFNKPYPTAPFSNLYLFGRPFDLGFQIPYGDELSPRHRHHVRFWSVIDVPGLDKNNHFAYWIERLKNFGKKRTVWIGAAIDDTSPYGIRWRNLQITHRNGEDHSLERDFIIGTLKNASQVKSIHLIKDGEPFKMRSQNIGRSFVVDGEIKVVELKTKLFSTK